MKYEERLNIYSYKIKEINCLLCWFCSYGNDVIV